MGSNVWAVRVNVRVDREVMGDILLNIDWRYSILLDIDWRYSVGLAHQYRFTPKEARALMRKLERAITTLEKKS